MPRTRLIEPERFVLQLIELRIEFNPISVLDVMITGEVVTNEMATRSPICLNRLPRARHKHA